MIDKIRKHPKVILVIFGLVCMMFVGEIFMRYYLYPRESRNEKIEEGPTVVNILGEKLEFDEYKKKAKNIQDYYGNFYKMYGLNIDNAYFSMMINNSVINDFINSVSLKHIAKELNITIEDNEKKDVIYGDNIDSNIKDSFKGKDGNFDRDKYDEFLKNMDKNIQMKTYWAKEQQNIFDMRIKNKISNILKNLSYVNSLELKHKWEENNKTIDIEFAALLKDEKDFNFEENKEKMKEYIINHKNKFKNEEGYDITYFINNFAISKKLKEKNLENLDPIINKFMKSKNPVEFAKIKSDQDVNNKKGNKIEYATTYDKSNLPKVFNDEKNITKGLIKVELATKMDEFNKIYNIYDIDNSNGVDMYKIAILYKKPYIDDTIKEMIINDIEENLQKVSNKEEFKALADEYGYKTKDLNLYYFLTNTDFSNNKLLKKTLYEEFIDDKSSRNIPLVIDKDSAFVGFMNKYIKKDSIKDIDDDDVKKKLTDIFKNKNNKKQAFDLLNKNGLTKLNIDELKTNDKCKDFIFSTENNIKFDEKNDKLKNTLLKSIINRLFLLPKDFETSFINGDSHIIKIKVKDIKNKDIVVNSNEYTDFKNKEIKNIRDNNNFELLFETIYNTTKNDNAYFLI